MNNLDKQYIDLIKKILDHGVVKEDRTGTGTKSIFGHTIRHQMSEGFPLLTTKKMAWKSIVTELLWFLRGDTNIKFLLDNDCHIWDGDAYQSYLKEHSKNPNGTAGLNDGTPFNKSEFIALIQSSNALAKKWGSLGKIYGKQWRSWSGNGSPLTKDYEGNISSYLVKPIDQIANLINELKTNPDSRRLMVSAWNVGELDQMVLPPCHYGFQVYTRKLTLAERIKVAMSKCPDFNSTDFGHSDGIPEEDFQHQELDRKYPGLPQRAISLLWTQRSVDVGLGLPFNIASYGLLLEILAKEVNMVPDELIGSLGDTHLYSNHIEPIKEQLGRKMTVEERMDWWFKNNKPNRDVCDAVDEMPDHGKHTTFDISSPPVPKQTREPYPLPTLKIEGNIGENLGKVPFDEVLRDMTPHDFTLENYQSHPQIKLPLSN